MAVSRGIVERFVQLPDEGQIMHDWSLLNCGYLMGAKISYCSERLVKYRQHDRNVLGTKSNLSKVRLLINMPARMRAFKAQYDCFQLAFSKELPKSFYSVDNFKSLVKAPFLRPWYRLALLLFFLVAWVQFAIGVALEGRR